MVRQFSLWFHGPRVTSVLVGRTLPGSKINYGPDAKIILEQGFVIQGGIVYGVGLISRSQRRL